MTHMKEVLLVTEFDYWKPRDMLRCNDGTFELKRMAPPGNCQYYFIANGRKVVAQADPIQPFQSRIVCGVPNKIKGLPLLVNNVDVQARPHDVEIGMKPREISINPRMENENWFPTSVFAGYKQDTPENLRCAFESDWMMSRVRRSDVRRKFLNTILACSLER